MNIGDLKFSVRQMIQFIEQHSVTVLDATNDAITVDTLFSDNGRAVYQRETVPATWQDVRNYLGY